MASNVTAFQERVYTLLKQIPSGRVTTYAAMARALGSSPRAVGGALRVNPFAPEVPCHRCIASTGVRYLPLPHPFFVRGLWERAGLTCFGAGQYLGGFKGDWEDAPSGVNQQSKLKLLGEEGVRFDGKGMLVDKSMLWSDFEV
jgi:methylated-DNA-[protein]-cysteine S-methyltransferase